LGQNCRHGFYTGKSRKRIIPCQIYCPRGKQLFIFAAARLPFNIAPLMAEPTPRADGRAANQLRPVRFQNHIAPHAAGSTLIEWGSTRVICGVTVEENVPRWMKEQKVEGGWLTAEYSMLPYSTLERKPRDITKGKLDGRASEIQRLIGRSMRAAIDLHKIGARTICVDCDVLQADGGTRTAAITGAFVALSLAVNKLLAGKKVTENPMLHAIAAASIGIVNGQPLLDLCYTEDVAASVDMNLVMNSAGEFIEVQGSGEEATFTESQLADLLALGKSGIRELFAAQQKALAEI
jgi:ribonuclease PH